MNCLKLTVASLSLFCLAILFATPVAALPVTSGLMAHWDASSQASTTGFGPVKPGGFDAADGDQIDRWSANGASGIINATGGDMPTYRATGLNGAPGVEFNGATGGSNQLGVGNGITNAGDLDIGTNSFTAFVVAKVTDHGVAPSIFFEGRGGGHLGPTFFLEHRNSNQTSDTSSGKTLAAQVNTPNGVAGYNSPAESSTQAPFPLDLEDGTTRIHVTVFDRNDDGDGTGAYFGVNAPATFQGVKDDGVTSSIPLGNGDSDGTFKIGFGQGQSLPGMIGDIVLYDRELSNAEQVQLGNFLASKYGISFVPEPGSLMMIAMGMLGFLSLSLRRRTS